MPTRNVVLSDHQASVIEMLVKSGRYQNASEVVRDGLRLVEQRAAEDELRLQALRKAAEFGWNDLAAGRFTEVDDEGLADLIAGLGREAAARVRLTD